tara:strand:- start:352 stop:981 length:630 start_codon:yes stop_codon:yes gene_type:complete
MKKTNSQHLWLNRRDKDCFFKKSKKEGYRSRAAYKLLEINKKYKLINSNSKVIDLGSSPGSWTQVVSNIINDKKGQVISIDQKKMDPIENNFFLLSDIKRLLEEEKSFLKTKYYDLILSDMAPNSVGHKFTDQSRAETISYLALEFTKKYLRYGGNFVCKFIRGEGEKKFINDTKLYFCKTKIYKPAASRKESKEIYLIGLGFNNLHKS